MQAILYSSDNDETVILEAALTKIGLRTYIHTDFVRASQCSLILVTSPSIYTHTRSLETWENSEIPTILIKDYVDKKGDSLKNQLKPHLVIHRPYCVPTLILQIQGILRLKGMRPAPDTNIICTGEVLLDIANWTVKVGEKKVQALTRLEFRLLRTLMMNKDQTLSTEVLIEHIWGYSGEGDKTLLRNLVRRLRDKIEIQRHNPKIIQTVPYLGYTIKTK